MCVLIVVWIAVCMHAFVRARVHACVCCRMCGDTRVCVCVRERVREKERERRVRDVYVWYSVCLHCAASTGEREGR